MRKPQLRITTNTPIPQEATIPLRLLLKVPQQEKRTPVPGHLPQYLEMVYQVRHAPEGTMMVAQLELRPHVLMLEPAQMLA